VSVLFSDESFMLSVSDVSDSGKGRLGIGLVSEVGFKTDFSSGKRVRACGVMGESSVVGIVTISNFLVSESEFSGTVSLLDFPHSVVSGLFFSDLSIEFFDSVKD